MNWRYVAITAVAALTAYIAASLFLFPRMALRPDAKALVDSPADVGLDFTSVTIPGAEADLAAWWMPATQPRAQLVFAHGIGSNRSSEFFNSLGLYRALVDRNVSVLSIDLRNHGQSMVTDGWVQMGRTEWKDLVAAVDWLETTGGGTTPTLLMGISMGGATVIHAATEDVAADALLLVDPALDNMDALASGGWVNFGLPRSVFYPYAWASVQFYGVPDATDNAQSRGRLVRQPTLLVQDPADPITRAAFAQELAEANPAITLALAPSVSPEAPCVNFKGRWGTHVAAFHCHPEWFLNTVERFLRPLVTADKVMQRGTVQGAK
ncbi:conserved hypothetical protein [Luminiphilus syltensis NOR5-1B]|uniref:Serine aminopeptidase S33 domain-containing protein n=1 Tax=Luminiphilus syltensis NOR5-1B TaxID=565045 RepID=B8KS92_9GAMM|nr:alpha/beta fold hydrolase [Luminiphilus syltensis]EED35589.1 conserved hypothetical protein [Luminiphilus syltensis NOR5-1B]